jgi:hypothetical protein
VTGDVEVGDDAVTSESKDHKRVLNSADKIAKQSLRERGRIDGIRNFETRKLVVESGLDVLVQSRVLGASRDMKAVGVDLQVRYLRRNCILDRLIRFREIRRDGSDAEDTARTADIHVHHENTHDNKI